MYPTTSCLISEGWKDCRVFLIRFISSLYEQLFIYGPRDSFFFSHLVDDHDQLRPQVTGETSSG